jgi:hypothetical protein
MSHTSKNIKNSPRVKKMSAAKCVRTYLTGNLQSFAAEADKYTADDNNAKQPFAIGAGEKIRFCLTTYYISGFLTCQAPRFNVLIYIFRLQLELSRVADHDIIFTSSAVITIILGFILRRTICN